jgi:glycosyltransferase involved in cell wall biosynthesis
MYKLTTIIPNFNNGAYLSKAIDSVLNQETDFDHQIIVIDDCSTDNSKQILSKYGNIRNLDIVWNNKNRGKGHCVKVAHDLSKSEFFSILDSDDFYISRYRMQKHLDFLSNNNQKVGVGSKHFEFSPMGVRVIDDKTSAFFVKALTPHLNVPEFNFQNIVQNTLPYIHTSGITFRRICDKLPEYFETETAFRGDTALLWFLLYESNLKIGFIDEFLSAYRITETGIWNGLSAMAQCSLDKEFLTKFLEYVVHEEDSRTKNFIVEKIAATMPEHFVPKEQYEWLSFDNFATTLKAKCNSIFLKENSELFTSVNSLRDIDQACEFIGIMQDDTRAEITPGKRSDDGEISIFVVSGFAEKSGGIFLEIKDFLRIHNMLEKKVCVVSTETFASNRDYANEQLNKIMKDIEIKYLEQRNILKKSEELINFINKKQGANCFFWITHNDIAQNISISSISSKQKVLVFSYDHGTSLGVTNSQFTRILVKSEFQSNQLLTLHRKEKIVFVPIQIHSNPQFNDHTSNTLVSASGAMREYKFFQNHEIPFYQIAIDLLSKFKGRHYHFGPISETKILFLEGEFSKAGVPFSKFIHIPYEPNFQKSLIDLGVNLFINTYPVSGARISVEVQGAGIASINHTTRLNNLPTSTDFIGEQQFNWSSYEDLQDIYKHINFSSLQQKGIEARNYFDENNNLSKNLYNIYLLSSFSFIEKPNFNFGFHDISKSIDFDIENLDSYEKLIDNYLDLRNELVMIQKEFKNIINSKGNKILSSIYKVRDKFR